MNKETQKISKAALCFMDHECFAQVKVKDDQDQLLMVAYSGGIIKGHWYWDSLAIDLSGMSFPKSKYPVLENHDRSKKLAFSKKPKIDSGALVIDSAEFVDTPESLEFRKLSKQGFPYESSIYATPTVIERVLEGASVKVNGMTMKGPGTVWRKCVYKEASACVFGYDSNTKATAFADEEIELTVETVGDKIIKEEVTHMTLAELKVQHPGMFAEFKTEVETGMQVKFDGEKASMEAKFVEDKAQLETKHAEEKADLEKASGLQLSERDERILKLEKSDVIRTESEREKDAKTTWTDKLSNSAIDPRLHEKIMGYVPASKFVKDDAFDREAFAAAVDAEIKDWEGRLPKHSSVIGGGFAPKDAVSNDKLVAEEAEDEKLADEIYKSGGNRGEVK